MEPILKRCIFYLPQLSHNILKPTLILQVMVNTMIRSYRYLDQLDLLALLLQRSSQAPFEFLGLFEDAVWPGSHRATNPSDRVLNRRRT